MRSGRLSRSSPSEIAPRSFVNLAWSSARDLNGRFSELASSASVAVAAVTAAASAASLATMIASLARLAASAAAAAGVDEA